jgi:hypothetical protein
LRSKTRPTRARRRDGSAKAGNAMAGGGYLFNHKALAKVFRDKVRQAIERAGLVLPDKLPATWVVDCKSVGDGSKALLYLGRYLYRGVIQERDILRCDEAGDVSFRYRDAKTGKMAVRTLPGADFLWLVLQHVLPKGLRRARNFGFLHPNSAGAIGLLQVLHLRAAPAAASAAPPRPAWRCACGQPMFVVCRRMPAQQPDGLGQPDVGQHQPSRVIRPDKPDAGQARTMH